MTPKIPAIGTKEYQKRQEYLASLDNIVKEKMEKKIRENPLKIYKEALNIEIKKSEEEIKKAKKDLSNAKYRLKKRIKV